MGFRFCLDQKYEDLKRQVLLQLQQLQFLILEIVSGHKYTDGIWKHVKIPEDYNKVFTDMEFRRLNPSLDSLIIVLLTKRKFP